MATYLAKLAMHHSGTTNNNVVLDGNVQYAVGDTLVPTDVAGAHAVNIASSSQGELARMSSMLSQQFCDQQSLAEQILEQGDKADTMNVDVQQQYEEFVALALD